MKRLSLIIALLLPFLAMSATRNVAISYFDNNAKDPELDPLSKGIADMLITELSNADAIRVVERERLEELLDEIELSESGYIDPETAQKLGKGLGADAILTGAFTVQAEQMRIDARLIEVESGQVLLSEKVKGRKDAFFTLHDQLSRKLLEALNSASRPDLSEKNESVSFRSVVDYSKALDQQDHGLGEKAKATLEKTLQRSPDFGTAKSKLDSVEAWLSELEAKRRKRLKEDLEQTLEELDPQEENLGQELNSIWSRLLASREYNKLVEFNRLLREKGIEADQQLYQGAEMSFGQTAGHYDLTALYQLKRYGEFLSQAREYLEKYPESPQFESIKMQVRQAAEEMEAREKGKASAENAIAELDTNELSRKELLKEHASIYNEEHQYPDEIAVRWGLLQNTSLKQQEKELQYFLLAQAYREMGAFNECKRIGEVMERKFPESDYTESLKQVIRYLPK